MNGENGKSSLDFGRPESEVVESWKAVSPIVVSIVCLTYNHESFLIDALRGFVAQNTSFPFEIVIHDDASTDGTVEVISDFCSQYPRLSKPVLQTENQYRKGVRIISLAISFAVGEYIAICEGDDYWCDPDKLEKQVGFLQKNPDFVITYHDSFPFDETGTLDIDMGGATCDLSASALQRGTPIFTLTSCFRNVFREAGFPREIEWSGIGDLFLWSLLGQHGQGKYLPDIRPAAYRVHQGGVFSTKTMSEKKMLALSTAFALGRYYQRVSAPDLARYFLQKSFLNLLVVLGIKGILGAFVDGVKRKFRTFGLWLP